MAAKKKEIVDKLPISSPNYVEVIALKKPRT